MKACFLLCHKLPWAWGLLATVFFFPATATAGELVSWSGPTMGTRYSVKLYVESEPVQIADLQLEVDSELRRVNDEMSTYLKSSTISRFNRSDSTDWFPVEQDFADVVAYAQAVSAATEGAFDITVGPLVDAWNFGAAPRTDQIPSDETLDAIRSRVGYHLVMVRQDPPSLKKQIPEVQIDLSSIAKGHGVDRVVRRLRAAGIGNCFVEIGGEVRTTGSKGGQPWKVGVQTPDAQLTDVTLAYPLSTDTPQDASMATSGDYRNYFVADGKRYSHTIDPRTMRPVDHQLASVSVLRDSCMQADAWATALNVLGPERGIEVAQREGISAYFITRSGDELADYTGTHAMAGLVPAKLKETASDSAADAPAEGSSFLLVFGITLFAFVTVLLAMAVGVIFNNKAISGSCGGLNGTKTEDGKVSCSLCSNPADACKELREKMQKA